RKDTQFGLRRVALYAAYLLQRTVFVVFALDGQDGASDVTQVGFDVPGAEFGVQPDVVPAPEGRVRVVVMASELARQIGVQVGLPRSLDVGDGDVFDEIGRASCRERV